MQDLSTDLNLSPTISISGEAAGVGGGGDVKNKLSAHGSDCRCPSNNNMIGKTLTNFIMFFESSRRDNYEIEQRKFQSNASGTQFEFDSDSGCCGSDNGAYNTLRSQTPISDCHGHNENSLSTRLLSTSTLTTDANSVAPQPAPRKSLYDRHSVLSNKSYATGGGDAVFSGDCDMSSNQVREFTYSTVKLRALKIQQCLTAEIRERQKQHCNEYKILMRNNTRPSISILPTNNTKTGNIIKEYQKETPHDERLAPPLHDNIAASASTFVDDESDDSSTTDDIDTEDSQDNKMDRPKPGKLDLRQFDNITTAIGKLNVQTTSSSAKVSTKTTTSTNTNLQRPPVESARPNTRRIPKNPRQNHGRAVAPPKLPTGLLSRGNSVGTMNATGDCNVPTNEIINQLNNESNCAIDFSQSPIAQRLLKHSKDHKVTNNQSKPPDAQIQSVSELNSPYESDNEQTTQQVSHHFVRGHSELSKKDTDFNINSSIDSCELINSRGAAIRTQLNEILANKQPPGRPGSSKTTSKGSLLDQPDLQASSADPKKIDKDIKKDKKKIRSDEKLEKRKLKEEERLRRQEEEKLRRQEKKLASKKSKPSSTGSNSVGDDGIPLFIKRCIEYIESEGLDAEGIYRVPGNRAHVDAFVQKFKDNNDMSIVESDIPVNAVATALKDFLSKKWGPIIPLNLMNELTELSNIAEKEHRVEAVRTLVRKLPATNYCLLKYVFAHFVRVSLNHSLNSMDSKNLAICWWPTLLPLHFNDMIMFEQMRPHLEESIQTMIDQFDFIFQSESSTPTVS